MAKKKLKKILKKVAPLALGLLGAAALGKRKKRADSIAANEAKEFGFGQMKLKDFGPYSNKRGFVPVNMMTPQDMADDEMFMGAMAKKGGRIRKTKKGGRAVRKANRSKKK